MFKLGAFESQVFDWPDKEVPEEPRHAADGGGREVQDPGGEEGAGGEEEGPVVGACLTLEEALEQLWSAEEKLECAEGKIEGKIHILKSLMYCIHCIHRVKKHTEEPAEKERSFVWM